MIVIKEFYNGIPAGTHFRAEDFIESGDYLTLAYKGSTYEIPKTAFVSMESVKDTDINKVRASKIVLITPDVDYTGGNLGSHVAQVTSMNTRVELYTGRGSRRYNSTTGMVALSPMQVYQYIASGQHHGKVGKIVTCLDGHCEFEFSNGLKIQTELHYLIPCDQTIEVGDSVVTNTKNYFKVIKKIGRNLYTRSGKSYAIGDCALYRKGGKTMPNTCYVSVIGYEHKSFFAIKSDENYYRLEGHNQERLFYHKNSLQFVKDFGECIFIPDFLAKTLDTNLANSKPLTRQTLPSHLGFCLFSKKGTYFIIKDMEMGSPPISGYLYALSEEVKEIIGQTDYTIRKEEGMHVVCLKQKIKNLLLNEKHKPTRNHRNPTRLPSSGRSYIQTRNFTMPSEELQRRARQRISDLVG